MGKTTAVGMSIQRKEAWDKVTGDVKYTDDYITASMPAALANALSSASQTDLTQLPVTPEYIWRTKTGGKYPL